MKNSEFVFLNNIDHAQLKLKAVNGYSFAKDSHLVSLVLHEFPKASANYPIVFVKKQNTDKFMPMALLGLEPENNLFVNDQFNWLPGVYIPAAFRRYPFALGQTNDNSMALCFDVKSDFLTVDAGVALFNSEGQPTDELVKVKNFVYEIYKSELLAQNFCDKLAELDLLVPNGFKVQGPDGIKHYDGSFVIDEKKLASLDAEGFLSLRDSGYLVPIYAHLFSLLQVEKLGSLRTI